MHLKHSSEISFLHSEIRHPNITRLLATTITTATNAMTLILDPINGGSFADAIYKTNEQFTTEYICHSVIKMAEALQFLHQGSIVHNFVNAQSMYRSENNVVLGDFIYAQKLDGNTVPISDITAQVPWMAPTQANGELPDRFSDIYRSVCTSRNYSFISTSLFRDCSRIKRCTDPDE